MRYTKYGVPILKNDEIEQRAYSLLSEYDGYSLNTPCKVPLAGIFNYLKNNYDLKIVFTDLGIKNDYKILGRTIFSKNMICIDENIVYHNESLFLFTGAHELGHWVLHRNKEIKNENTDGSVDQMDDYEKDFWGRKILKTSKDWLEHHANFFAASLLMPRDTFKKAVISIQHEMRITRNIGKILLNKQPGAERDFAEIILHLQNIFGTSKESIKIRLKDLDILDEDKSLRLRHISE